MSRRSRIRKYQVLTNGDTTTTLFSKETEVSTVDFVIYDFTIQNTVNATLSVYYCNDEVYNSANLSPLNFGQATPLSGATDTKYMVVIENKGFKWIVLKLVNNGGSGTANAWVTGTVRGA